MQKVLVLSERLWANSGAAASATPPTTGSVFWMVPTTGTSGTFIANASVSTAHWKTIGLNVPGGVDEIVLSYRGTIQDVGGLTNCTAHSTSIVAVGDHGAVSGRQSGLDLFLPSFATPAQTSANAATYGNGCLLVTVPRDGRSNAAWATSTVASVTQGHIPISSPVSNGQFAAWDVNIGIPQGGGTSGNSIATPVTTSGLSRIAIAVAVNTTFTGNLTTTLVLGEMTVLGYQYRQPIYNEPKERVRLSSGNIAATA